MSKIISFAKRAVIYFLIVLSLYWISKKAGIYTESSIFTSAICLTIGWAIVQVALGIINKFKQKKEKNI